MISIVLFIIYQNHILLSEPIKNQINLKNPIKYWS